MRMRSTIGIAMVALLVLASPLPAMCSQCQFDAAKSNCHVTSKQAGAPVKAASRATAGEHCQHMASSQAQSESHLITGPCQAQSCRHLLDAAATMNRSVFSQRAHGLRTLAATGASSTHIVVEHSTSNRIESPPINPPAYQPLSVSLRI